MVHCHHPPPYHPHTQAIKFNIIIINIDDDGIDFGGLGVGGDMVEDGENVLFLALPPYDYRIDQCFLSNNLTSPGEDS